MKLAVCIIGAGYSFVGGLPLTKDLLTSEIVVVSKQTRQRFQRIWRHYEEWQHKNPSRNPEEYLADLYNNPVKMQMPPFQWAVELLAAVLATPRGYDVRATNPRYGVRVTQPSWCAEHISFWKTVVSLFNVIAVVTTNYDLLIERILRHRPMKRSFGPGFYYGCLSGLPGGVHELNVLAENVSA